MLDVVHKIKNELTLVTANLVQTALQMNYCEEKCPLTTSKTLDNKGSGLDLLMI